MNYRLTTMAAVTCLLSASLPALAYESVKLSASEDISKDAILIDVRSAKEYEEGHLKNAINIPHEEIAEQIQTYVKDKKAKIVVYCKIGGRAQKAHRTLVKLGYSNVTNAGGYEKLKGN